MGQDEWDKKLIERDARIIEEAARIIEEAKEAKKKPSYAFTGNQGKKWMGMF